MLRSPRFLTRYTWSYFMVYLAGITNFALLWDVALVMALPSHGLLPVLALLSWFFFTKTVKLYPHLARHPDDILLLPAQIAFVYVHSVVKFWALLTFWDCGWSGRNLDEIATEGQEYEWEEVESDEVQ